MSETLDVEGRGSFYEGVGAIRDVLQNHVLQVVSLLAMEPPAGADSGFLQDEKAKVITAMRPIDTDALVRGQYVGYRDEPGVDPNSDVETFVAVRLEIDSWRWAGVPWYIRVGKALPQNATEAVVELREPPRMLFDESGGPPPGRNLIRLRLGSNDGVTFALQAKTPGPDLDSQEVDVDVDFAAALGQRDHAALVAHADEVGLGLALEHRVATLEFRDDAFDGTLGAEGLAAGDAVEGLFFLDHRRLENGLREIEARFEADDFFRTRRHA